jgi:hypothetical protein
MSAPLPEPIEPERKSWIWVLERACPECGFDATTFDVTTMGAALDDNARRWATVLARPDARTRPQASVWSPLEYGCHVRDVFRIFDGRLHLMLDDDGPHFANWDQDASAVEERYDLQDPEAVARELRANADALAATYRTVTDWGRTGFRSDGAAFTIESFTRYLLHDPLHHLFDVGG